MGIRFKAVLMSGHKAPNFQTFLMQHFGKTNVDIGINNSVLGKLGRPQEYVPRVYCSN